MEVESVIRSLERDGAVFEVTGQRIKLRAKRGRAPAPEQLAHLEQHRAEILAFLNSRASNRRDPDAEPVTPIDAALPTGHDEKAGMYNRQLNELMRRICNEPYQEGMFDWLSSSHVDLYHALLTDLPFQIDRLCAARVAPELFQAALERLFDGFKTALDLYAKRIAIQEEGSGSDIKEGRADVSPDRGPR